MTEQRNVSRTLPLAPLSPAERMHRVRQRRRNGLRCLTIELRATEIDALVNKGLLEAETRNHAQSVLKALYAFFERTLN